MPFKKHLSIGTCMAAAIVATAMPSLAEGLKVGQALPLLTDKGLVGEIPETAGKVVILDFWASWCKPCHQAMPYLDSLYKAHAEDGLVVIGISCDDHAKNMNKFLKRIPVTFPVLHDASQQVVSLCDIKAMPTSLIIGRDGTIRHIHSGFFKGKSEPELEAQLKTLLAEPVPEGAPQ